MLHKDAQRDWLLFRKTYIFIVIIIIAIVCSDFQFPCELFGGSAGFLGEKREKARGGGAEEKDREAK